MHKAHGTRKVHAEHYTHHHWHSTVSKLIHQSIFLCLLWWSIMNHISCQNQFCAAWHRLSILEWVSLEQEKPSSVTGQEFIILMLLRQINLEPPLNYYYWSQNSLVMKKFEDKIMDGKNYLFLALHQKLKMILLIIKWLLLVSSRILHGDHLDSSMSVPYFPFFSWLSVGSQYFAFIFHFTHFAIYF